MIVKRVIYLFVGKQSNLAVHTANFQPLRNRSKFSIFVDGSHIINIYNPFLHVTLLLCLQKIEVLEKLDHTHSKLRYRIEELEKLQANHSKQLDNHSEQLDHLSKEGEHQGKRLRRHSEELASLNKNVRTEDEEKETYSEFWDKKGINLCRLKHEIFMQIFVRCLVCKRYKKSNSVCVHTHRRTGAKLLERL